MLRRGNRGEGGETDDGAGLQPTGAKAVFAVVELILP
jgi:hypothetical protein